MFIVNATPRLIYSREKTRYPSYRRLGGRQGLSERRACTELLYRLHSPVHRVNSMSVTTLPNGNSAVFISTDCLKSVIFHNTYIHAGDRGSTVVKVLRYKS
jgi:hypothetical protein